MLPYSHYVVAFVPRGVESRGSSSTISYAKKFGKKNHRYRLDIYIYVYMKKQIKLTSVKIIESLYNNFKIKTVNSNMNLQKLVNRAIHQYLNDEEIKESIETYDKLHLSGSQF